MHRLEANNYNSSRGHEAGSHPGRSEAGHQGGRVEASHGQQGRLEVDQQQSHQGLHELNSRIELPLKLLLVIICLDQVSFVGVQL